jgi:hypothetical protein
MTVDQDTWAAPQVVDDVTLAFPANVVADLMPTREECEAALKAMPDRGRGWREFQRQWFFHGLDPKTTVNLREGIDGKTAFRHLSAIQGSFEPKHEHKEAAVAYLASRWFEDVPSAPKIAGGRRTV